jgi:hypothetical protein
MCTLFEPLGEARDTSSPTGGDDLPVQLLSVYNGEAHLIRSLKATAEVHVVRGPKFGASAGKSRTIGSFMEFEQPAWLRVTGVVPLAGSKVFDMSSDGREFHLLAPDHNKLTFFVGPVEAKPDFTAGNLNLRPQEFLDALQWGEGKLSAVPQKNPQSAERNETVDIDLPPRGGEAVTGKLKFDLRKGTISSLEISTSSGEVASEIHYADWRPMQKAPGQTAEGCFPRHVQVVHPSEDFQIDIRFLEITLNPRIDRNRFYIGAPRGVPKVRVED